MPSVILTVRHVKQQQSGDCLAACTAMVLGYLEFSVSYDHLLELLQVNWFGAMSSNVRALEELGLTVIFEQGDLAELYNHLSHGRPCIAFVRTGELPYWNENLAHAVVVSGLDDDSVYLNDPVVAAAPIPVSRGDFELAWLEWDELYATFIRRS
jgi:ABC-type bacteriocin/lantibiotic exporter with double-glycine peptidase domain